MPLLVAALLGVAAPAPAAESRLWQSVQEPSKARAERALQRVERVLDGVTQAEGDLDMMQDFRLGALAIAEMSGARALRDPRLALLLAQALLDADLGREAEAGALLNAVLAELEPSDAWLEARARVLLALAERESPLRAIAAINRALPQTYDPSARSTLLRKRGEAKMTLGDLHGSVSDQRAALAVARSALQKSLSRFALGLVLERGGDWPASERELRLARATAPEVVGSELGVLDLPGTFSFRRHDAHYVGALSEMAVGRSAVDPEAGALHYERALKNWERYQKAAPADDAFLASARRHRQECERALQLALEQVAALRRAEEASSGLW